MSVSWHSGSADPSGVERLPRARQWSPGRCAGAEPAAGGTDVTIESEHEMPLGFIGDAANKLFLKRSVAESWDKSMAKFKAIVEAEAPDHV